MTKALKIVLPIAALLAAAAGYYLYVVKAPSTEPEASVIPPPLVSVAPAKSGAMDVPVFTRGTVMPGTQMQLIAEVNGQVLEVNPNFTKGGFFHKGELLLRVDTREYDITIKKASAQQAQAYQLYLQAKAEHKARSRIKTGSQLASFETQYRQAEAQYLAAKAELEAIKMQRERAVLRAPFDGRVLTSGVNVGQYLRLGQQLGLIYSVDVAEVRLPLSDRFLNLVDIPGRTSNADPASLPDVTFTEQYAGKTYTWKGKIVRAEGSVDERNRLLYLVAEVSDPYGADPAQPGRPELVVGSFVEARIDGHHYDHIIPVPRRALRHGNRVWIVSQDGRLQKRDIEVLYKAQDIAYVTAGLQDGDQIVLSQLDVAVEGMRVRIQQDGSYQQQEETPAGPNPFAASKPLESAIRKAVKVEDGRVTLDASPLEAARIAAKAKELADSLTPEQKQQIKDSAGKVAEQLRNLQQNLAPATRSQTAPAAATQPQATQPQTTQTQTSEPSAAQTGSTESATTAMSPLAATLEADMAAQSASPANPASTSTISPVAAPRPLPEAAQ